MGEKLHSLFEELGMPMGTTILRTRYSERNEKGPMSRRFSSSVVVMSVSVVMVFVPPVGGFVDRSSQRIEAHRTCKEILLLYFA